MSVKAEVSLQSKYCLDKNSVDLCLSLREALLFGQAKWASRERASEGPRKGELATISHKFSFPPRKTRDSAKA